MTNHPSKSRTAYDPRYQKKWRIERARGHTRLTPATRAQAHVQALTAKGLSIRSIAELAQTDAGCISLLNRGLKKSLTWSREARILAVKSEAVFDRPLREGFVPNIGGRRRIQALLAIGWRHEDISAWIGSQSATALHQVGDWFSQEKHEAICRAYDAHWNRPGPSAKTVRFARKAGYAPPLAWDDDTIDDAAATPAGATKPRSIQEQRIEDLEHLLDTGTGYHELLQRLAVTRSTLDQTIVRAGRRDLATRLTNLTDARRSAAA